MADGLLCFDRSARADVQAVGDVDQPLVERMGELVRVVEVVVAAQRPGVRVGIEMQHGKAGVAACDRAQHGQADRAVAAQGERRGPGIEDRVQGLLDGREGAVDVRERQVDVAGIDNPALVQRVRLGVPQQGAGEDRGLAHGVGAKPCTEAGGIVAAVEGQADDGDVALAEVACQRQVEEGEGRAEG